MVANSRGPRTAGLSLKRKKKWEPRRRRRVFVGSSTAPRWMLFTHCSKRRPPSWWLFLLALLLLVLLLPPEPQRRVLGSLWGPASWHPPPSLPLHDRRTLRTTRVLPFQLRDGGPGVPYRAVPRPVRRLSLARNSPQWRSRASRQPPPSTDGRDHPRTHWQ